MITAATPDSLKRHFPNLAAGDDFEIVSEATNRYNCIAFAADSTSHFWWPPVAPEYRSGRYYWPPTAPSYESIDAFAAMFAGLGYTECQSGSFEVGIEKIALYALDGEPTHAARQCLRTGQWVSKLGQNVDITHERADSLEDATCGNDAIYGEVVRYMRRPLAPPL